MLRLVTNKIGTYFSSELNLSEIDETKLKYSLEIILTDLSKFILLLLFFSFIGKSAFFIITFPFLSLLRMLTGGLHFKTYLGCLSFSFAFFLAVFICSTYVHPSDIYILLIFLFSLITMYIAAPVPTKGRPKHSHKKTLRFKALAILLIIFGTLLFYITHKNPLLASYIWVMLFQSIQLLISKEVMKHDQGKKTIKKPTSISR